ncbi:MAG: DUF2911 domain-containing protein [Gemmatimonadaceae bacterium]
MLRTQRAIALIAALAAAPTLAAQGREHTGAFIIRLGNDTTAVERFARTTGNAGASYSVEQVVRSPRTSLRHTHLELTPADEIGTLFLMYHAIGAPMDAPLLGSAKLTAAGDSAAVEVHRGDTVVRRRIAARAGAIPSLAQSFLGYELAARRMRALGRDSMTFSFLSPTGGVTPIIARRVGPDSMTFTLPFLTYRAHLTADGRITKLYQPRGTTVERVENVDVNGLATTWSQLDASGKAMGPLSPADSTAGRVGEATVTIRYARPRTRGRVIFGDIVPWDTVWRTGANAATTFTTTRDLIVGETMVPAGSYSLFTLPSRSGTTLILNRETMRDGEPLGGTDYDMAKDFARIPMTTTMLTSHVEPFTIEIVPRGNAAVVRLAWDRREMTVPIRLRP